METFKLLALFAGFAFVLPVMAQQEPQATVKQFSAVSTTSKDSLDFRTNLSYYRVMDAFGTVKQQTERSAEDIKGWADQTGADRGKDLYDKVSTTAAGAMSRYTAMLAAPPKRKEVATASKELQEKLNLMIRQSNELADFYVKNRAQYAGHGFAITSELIKLVTGGISGVVEEVIKLQRDARKDRIARVESYKLKSWSEIRGNSSAQAPARKTD